MAGGKASAKKIELAQRRHTVLDLRRQGGSWRDIADTLVGTLDTDAPVPGVTPKYSEAHARYDAMAVLKELVADNQAWAELELAAQLEELRELWAKFYDMAKERGDYLAFDRCMVIQNRRLKLLGLETPQKIALTDPTGQKEYGAGLSDTERLAALRAVFDAASKEDAGPDTRGSEAGGV